ncbi:MAG: flagellar hook-associated protein 3, partial [Lachnospiraceae bacterium]|nr:flagellar hook-associated protein 3 [Lachnospiraceae bacterium]
EYKQTVDLAITDTGSRSSRLELTKTRMTAQKSSLQELIHSNEDRELSDILIDYETANLAYQSSLKAASEINQMTLLTYL